MDERTSASWEEVLIVTLVIIAVEALLQLLLFLSLQGPSLEERTPFQSIVAARKEMIR